MIGTAPAVYKKKIFEKVCFDGNVTTKIDDTDFIFRLSQYKEFSYGIGNTRIRQLHFAGFKEYLNKFMWYGYGDGEFVHKHPYRAPSILFHILVRYPVLYSFKAFMQSKYRAILFFILQGTVRFLGLNFYFLKILFGKKS
jgi:hypothetical protein